MTDFGRIGLALTALKSKPSRHSFSPLLTLFLRWSAGFRIGDAIPGIVPLAICTAYSAFPITRRLFESSCRQISQAFLHRAAGWLFLCRPLKDQFEKRMNLSPTISF